MKGRGWRAFCGVGAQCAPGLCGGRLQRLGRPPSCDAPAQRYWRVGKSSSPLISPRAVHISMRSSAPMGSVISASRSGPIRIRCRNCGKAGNGFIRLLPHRQRMSGATTHIAHSGPESIRGVNPLASTKCMPHPGIAMRKDVSCHGTRWPTVSSRMSPRWPSPISNSCQSANILMIPVGATRPRGFFMHLSSRSRRR